MANILSVYSEVCISYLTAGESVKNIYFLFFVSQNFHISILVNVSGFQFHFQSQESLFLHNKVEVFLLSLKMAVV